MKNILMLILATYVVTAPLVAHANQALVKVFTDSRTGVSWSQILPGTYSNGCVNSEGRANNSFEHCTFQSTLYDGPQVRPDGSMAAKACREFRARLPTRQDFESLIKNFNSSENATALTEEGLARLQATFDDMNNIFWTSTVVSSSLRKVTSAYFFDGYYGIILNDERYKNKYAVRCVWD